MSKLLGEYFDYHDKYTRLYGDTVVILIQIGSFYEIISTRTKGPNLEKLSAITKPIKSKAIHGFENFCIGERIIDNETYFTIAFPVADSKKYIDLLTDNHFIVVSVSQIKPPPNLAREVTGIYINDTCNTNISINSCTDEEILYECLHISI
jgi:hypothetical protein